VKFFFGKWGQTKVALKSVKEQECDSQFLNEFNLLVKLKHPNIVSCFGIHKSLSGKMFMVMEYVSLGSLDSILRQKEEELKENDLRNMILGASLGMEYLENNGVLHRDMACRNLLATKINDEYAVKCCDFGLSKESSYYYAKVSSSTKIPIRWSAPEILKGKKYTSKADVWSFGITMWEVFSFAELPYAWLSNHEVYEAVTNNNNPFILSKPKGCPEEIFQLIKRCCVSDPESRPSFSEIARNLEKGNSFRKDANSVYFNNLLNG